MLARLLLALLVALLPLPATAAGPACHQSAQMAADAGHAHARHSNRDELPAPIEKSCLGCIAPSTWRTPMIETPPGYAPETGIPIPAPGLARPASPPATPPPRSRA